MAVSVLSTIVLFELHQPRAAAVGAILPLGDFKSIDVNEAIEKDVVSLPLPAAEAGAHQ
jgi:hypothetical protein